MTSESLAVEFTVAAFRRAKFVGGGKVLRLDTNLGDDVAIPALSEACQAVTDHFEERESVDEVYVRMGGVTPGPTGPMVQVQECEPGKALTRMLERLAEELSERGISGKLVPVRTVSDSHFGNHSFRALGMMLSPVVETDAMYAAIDSWPMGLPRVGRWTEPERLRRVVTILVEWATQIEGRILVGAVDQFEIGRDAVSEYLLSALPHDEMLFMSVATKDNLRRRAVSFNNLEIIVTDYDPATTRTAQLEDLTDLAARLAPDLSYLMVRELSTGTWSAQSVGRSAPRIDLVGEIGHHIAAATAHMQHDYVFDAGVAQILTTSQLTKTRLDPSRWDARDLGNERHLVTHRTPESWLDPDPTRPERAQRDGLEWPSPDVVAHARTDFADAILTLDTIRAHPAPITTEQATNTPGLRWFQRVLEA